MVPGLESVVGDFEAKVLEGIIASSGAMLINGERYFGSIEVEPENRKAVLDFLREHQVEYGELHQCRSDPNTALDEDPTISFYPTEDQARALGKARDRAYTSTVEDNPLRYIVDVSVGGLISVIDDSCLC